MGIANVAGMVGLEAERRMCADNKIVNYANNTFYPIRVAAVEIGVGKIKMDIPMVNKSLVLNQQDLNELKDMLSH
jgi:hypothetical protein